MENRTRANILLALVGVGIIIHTLEHSLPDDEPAKSSRIETTTFTTSSQVGTVTTSTTTTL